MSRSVGELAELLEELHVPRPHARAAQPLLALAAHPDDEAIGASWVLKRARCGSVLFLTDGAPRDRASWPDCAPRTRQGFATLRAIEARCALAIVGVPPDRIACLHAVDHEASLHLTALSLAVSAIIARSRPGVVLTHAYEGGHPDHDAASFIVHAAVARLAPAHRPVVLEMTGYHRHHGALRIGQFIARGSPVAERALSGPERAAKTAMFSCYASQSAVLARFGRDRERYRRAPRYDFRSPPHRGMLHYETLGWPLDGRMWRGLAEHALSELFVPRADTGEMGRPP